MNTTIDKKRITVADYKTVKAELKEFKERYTDGDLAVFARNAIDDKFEQITGERYPYSSDVLRADVEAFDYDEFHGTYFRVEILLDSWREITKVSYYTNLHLEIDTEAKWNQFEGKYMYTFDVTRYVRKEDTGHILYSDVAV